MGYRDAAGDSEERRGCSGSPRRPIARSQLHRRSAGGCLCAPREALREFGDLVAVVEVFNGLLDTYSDAKADDDGGDVNEEVSPAVDGGVRRMDIEHSAELLRDRYFFSDTGLRGAHPFGVIFLGR